jgi:hypothetical protein
MDSTRKRFKTIDEYIETFPEEVQSILEKMSRLYEEPRLKPKRQSAIKFPRSS